MVTCIYTYIVSFFPDWITIFYLHLGWLINCIAGGCNFSFAILFESSVVCCIFPTSVFNLKAGKGLKFNKISFSITYLLAPYCSASHAHSLTSIEHDCSTKFAGNFEMWVKKKEKKVLLDCV